MTRTAKLRLVTVLLILTLISAGVLVDGYLRPATTQVSTVVCRFVHRLSLDIRSTFAPTAYMIRPARALARRFSLAWWIISRQGSVTI